MNVNTAQADITLANCLRQWTQLQVELGEPPLNAPKDKPWVIVYPQASPELAGSFGSPLDMGDLTYQVTCVGQVYTQAVLAEERVIATLATHWDEVTGCMGVPQVARRGTMRLEDNLWQAILAVTMKVSAA